MNGKSTPNVEKNCDFLRVWVACQKSLNFAARSTKLLPKLKTAVISYWLSIHGILISQWTLRVTLHSYPITSPPLGIIITQVSFSFSFWRTTPMSVRRKTLVIIKLRYVSDFPRHPDVIFDVLWDKRVSFS